MRLSIAWWNTSLSPLGKDRAEKNKATAEENQLAIDVVLYLLHGIGVDCLALGEVTEKNLNDFKRIAGPETFEVYNGVERSGHLDFDTGIIYRKDSLFLDEGASLSLDYAGGSIKIATKVKFYNSKDGEPLHFFISHWSSRLHCGENDPKRILMGTELSQKIKEVKKKCEKYNQPSNIILLGDYNDEPYAQSLSICVGAIRDRMLVRQKPELFYNPFWRHLGETLPHIPGKNCQSNCGTYYHAKGKPNRWYTFDQIIVSGTFLRPEGWQLNEKFTCILHEQFRGRLCEKGTIFDHFPVLCVIEKE